MRRAADEQRYGHRKSLRLVLLNDGQGSFRCVGESHDRIQPHLSLRSRSPLGLGFSFV
jgi:hypothetical protein